MGRHGGAFGKALQQFSMLEEVWLLVEEIKLEEHLISNAYYHLMYNPDKFEAQRFSYYG